MSNVSKIEYFGQSLIDLTNDTVTPETLDEGVTAHNAAGAPITGTRAVIDPSDYVAKSGDTMEGPLIAQSNISYLTPQVRNIVLVADGEDAPTTSNGDVIISYAPAITLITFFIGTSYTAEEGMTWSEWVDSEYNTGGYYIGYDGAVVYSTGDMCITTSDYHTVSSTDLIIEGEDYASERWF